MSEPQTITINKVEYIRKDSAKTVTYKPRKSGPWQIGKPYLIRTVTMTIHGVLVDVTPQELVFMDAAWIADTGRFSDFVKGGQPNEVEPFPRNKEVIVGRGSLVDAIQMDGDFKEQK
jgi:hypothetical protein